MSQKKARKAKFFEAHPYCCFCGGDEPATTEDHIPSRSIFLDRAWPEGFVFPACKACNAESSDDEVVVAMLARLGESDKPEKSNTELKRKIYEFTKQFPELREGFVTYSRPNERRILADHQMSAWNQQTHKQRKVIQLPKEVFNKAENFGVKLGKALHYMHRQSILPKTGAVKCKAISNAEFNNLGDEFFRVALKAPINQNIVRSAQPLLNQFVYRYLIHPETGIGLYIVVFGTDALMLLISVEPEAGLLDSLK